MSLPEPKQPFHNEMPEDDLSLVVTAMRIRGIRFQPPLDEGEIQDIERHNAFFFPPDLRKLLEIAVPHPSHGFTDWRKETPTPLATILRQKAANSICWQLTYCNLPWPFEESGGQPKDPGAMFDKVYEMFSIAPKMVPLLDRRFYMPCEPKRAGNPVFLISSSNHFALSYGGFNLSHFLIKRFGLAQNIGAKPLPRRVRFWQQFVTAKISSESE